MEWPDLDRLYAEYQLTPAPNPAGQSRFYAILCGGDVTKLEDVMGHQSFESQLPDYPDFQYPDEFLMMVEEMMGVPGWREWIFDESYQGNYIADFIVSAIHAVTEHDSDYVEHALRLFRGIRYISISLSDTLAILLGCILFVTGQPSEDFGRLVAVVLDPATDLKRLASVSRAIVKSRYSTNRILGIARADQWSSITIGRLREIFEVDVPEAYSYLPDILTRGGIIAIRYFATLIIRGHAPLVPDHRAELEALEQLDRRAAADINAIYKEDWHIDHVDIDFVISYIEAATPEQLELFLGAVATLRAHQQERITDPVNYTLLCDIPEILNMVRYEFIHAKAHNIQSTVIPHRVGLAFQIMCRVQAGIDPQSGAPIAPFQELEAPLSPGMPDMTVNGGESMIDDPDPGYELFTPHHLQVIRPLFPAEPTTARLAQCPIQLHDADEITDQVVLNCQVDKGVTGQGHLVCAGDIRAPKQGRPRCPHCRGRFMRAYHTSALPHAEYSGHYVKDPAIQTKRPALHI